MKTDEPFSDQLEDWLDAEAPKTMGQLGDVFGEKSFAVTILFLMFLPALPLPTGGITHVFEAITALLGAEMVLFGPNDLAPARWRDRALGDTTTQKAIPFMIRRIRWFERFSRRRWARLFEQRWFLRLVGLIVIGLAVAAAFAPPFSGLDTVPALGAVVVSLGVILGDVVILAIGVVIGAGGVADSGARGPACPVDPEPVLRPERSIRTSRTRLCFKRISGALLAGKDPDRTSGRNPSPNGSPPRRP
jgi:hypothetical protein